MEKKVFGVFEHKVVRPHNPLVRGFDETFYAPHSRHTEVLRSDIEACDKLRILADSPEGPHIISTENGRQIFVLGHQEYDKGTLAGEYFRDVKKGLDIQVPKNYFKDDDPEGGDQCSDGAPTPACCSPTGSITTSIRILLTTWKN